MSGSSGMRSLDHLIDDERYRRAAVRALAQRHAHFDLGAYRARRRLLRAFVGIELLDSRPQVRRELWIGIEREQASPTRAGQVRLPASGGDEPAEVQRQRVVRVRREHVLDE